MYQAYTQLGPQEKSVVAQLVSRDDLSDEYAFVVGVLNADPMLARTVITFLQAKEMEPVDRAFLLLIWNLNCCRVWVNWWRFSQ